jgi:hypothetical protein
VSRVPRKGIVPCLKKTNPLDREAHSASNPTPPQRAEGKHRNRFPRCPQQSTRHGRFSGLLIALHQPSAIPETRLRMCHPEKNRDSDRLRSGRPVLCIPLCLGTNAKYGHVSRILGGIEAGFSAVQTEWRRGRDSNPRYPFGYAGFQDRSHQPLGHLSAQQIIPFRASLQQAPEEDVLAFGFLRISSWRGI